LTLKRRVIVGKSPGGREGGGFSSANNLGRHGEAEKKKG